GPITSWRDSYSHIERDMDEGFQHVLMVVGPSLNGKSEYAKALVNKFLKEHPDKTARIIHLEQGLSQTPEHRTKLANVILYGSGDPETQLHAMNEFWGDLRRANRINQAAVAQALDEKVDLIAYVAPSSFDDIMITDGRLILHDGEDDGSSTVGKVINRLERFSKRKFRSSVSVVLADEELQEKTIQQRENATPEEGARPVIAYLLAVLYRRKYFPAKPVSASEINRKFISPQITGKEAIEIDERATLLKKADRALVRFGKMFGVPPRCLALIGNRWDPEYQRLKQLEEHAIP